MNNLSPEEIITTLDLSPHPEGGFYKETYRSTGTIGENSLPDNMVGYRTYGTSIYYLLRSHDFSAFHRIKSDEIWNFNAGDALEIFEIDGDGKLLRTVLGSDIKNGETLNHVVVANRWFAARPIAASKTKGYSLVTCIVAPGFDPQDFEMANASILREVIAKNPVVDQLLIP